MIIGANSFQFRFPYNTEYEICSAQDIAMVHGFLPAVDIWMQALPAGELSEILITGY